MSDIRVAGIGVGNMGTAHAKTIESGAVPGLVISGVSDPNPQRLAACGGRSVRQTRLATGLVGG